MITKLLNIAAVNANIHPVKSLVLFYAENDGYIINMSPVNAIRMAIMSILSILSPRNIYMP